MRTLTYVAKYYKDDKFLFEATMFAGHMGVFTGFKAGAFSITENQRTPLGTEEALITNVGFIFAGLPEVSWLIRETLTVCDDYACAYNKLT